MPRARTSSESPSRPDAPARYYSAIDGMRGVSVLVVLVFHFSRIWQPTTLLQRVYSGVAGAGWVGVEFFFVISGFLITGILCDSKEAPGYFANFYGRRILRILPAYFGFLLLMFLFLTQVSLFGSPSYYRELNRYQPWYWTFTTNVVLSYKNQGSGDFLPYGTSHFWSLAIEEQFYLVWPTVVLVLGRRRLAWACGAILVATVIARAALVVRRPFLGEDLQFLYYSTFLHFDGLAAGALVAIGARASGGLAPLQRWASAALAVGALVAAAVALTTGNFESWNRGVHMVGRSALPLLFAGMLATVLASPGGRLARALSLRPLRSIGRYSYAAYVIHFPLSFIAYDGLELAPVHHQGLGRWSFPFHLLVVAGCTAAVWILSALSFRFYEEPILRFKRWFSNDPARPRPHVRWLLAVALAAGPPLAAQALTHHARTDPDMRVASPAGGVGCDGIWPATATLGPTGTQILSASFSGAGFSTFAWETSDGRFHSPAGPVQTLRGYVALDSFDSPFLEGTLWRRAAGDGLSLRGGALRGRLEGRSDGPRRARLEGIAPLDGELGAQVQVVALEVDRGRGVAELDLRTDEGYRAEVALNSEEGRTWLTADTVAPDGTRQGSDWTPVDARPTTLRVIRGDGVVAFQYEQSDGARPIGSPKRVSMGPARVDLAVTAGDGALVVADFDNFGVAQNVGVVWGLPAGHAAGLHSVDIGKTCTATLESAPGVADTTASGPPAAGPIGCAPAATIPAQRIAPYVAVQPHRNACSMGELAGWASACMSAASSGSACLAWFASLGNVRCGACLNPVDGAGAATGAGATLFDPNGVAWPNTPGCIAATQGAAGACGPALWPFFECQFLACASCLGRSEADLEACLLATRTGACSQYFDAVLQPCTAALAAGGALGDKAACDKGQAVAVANAICGTGAGASAAGGGN